MPFRICLIIIMSLSLLACSSNDKQNNSDHIYKQQKQALDKAKEVSRMADDIEKKRRKTLEENSQ